MAVHLSGTATCVGTTCVAGGVCVLVLSVLTLVWLPVIVLYVALGVCLVLDDSVSV